MALRDRVAVAGVGYSPFSRHAGLSDLALSLIACKAALAHAALVVGALDGVGATVYTETDTALPLEVAHCLGVPHLTWFSGFTGNIPAAMASVVNTAAAIHAGLCETALIYRSMNRSGVRTQSPNSLNPHNRRGNLFQFKTPYDFPAATAWVAAWARRHMYEFGTRPEHLGAVGVNGRRNAAHNERAVYRAPFTIEDYFASRMIADPLRLLDCDVPIDGAIALVLTTPERARDLRQPPVRV